jgi:hypothetical protein
MSLIETFTSNKNKALLWNLMLEADLFKNINPANINNVKSVFESKIKAIVNSPETHINLIMMNKLLMREIIPDLNGMRDATPNIITNEEMSKNKQTQLNNAVKLHKQNFDTMINTKKPNDIDFRDKIDEPLGSEMDKLLSEAISKREKELNMIIQQQPDVNKANSWINENTNFTGEPTYKENKVLKIDNSENISIDVEEFADGTQVKNISDTEKLKTNKKVQFGKTEIIEKETSFLNLLKPKKDTLDNEYILNKLNEIHNDIKEIMHLLENNKNT